MVQWYGQRRRAEDEYQDWPGSLHLLGCGDEREQLSHLQSQNRNNTE